MEDFLGSVKLMLVVYALAALISMGVAWMIKLVHAGIRRQSAAGEPANATAKPADVPSGKAS
ncbi:MAG: hypothetical protein WCV99_08705 [Sterolibacterium sp.]